MKDRIRISLEIGWVNESVVNSEESMGKRFRRERGWRKEEIGDRDIGYIRVEGGVENISSESVLVI